MYNTIETYHLALEQGFTSIKAHLDRLRMIPQASIVQSPQPYPIQYHAVPLQEQIAMEEGPLPPLVRPPARDVYNVTSSPPLQQQQRNHAEMVAGKDPLAAQLQGDMQNLER